MLFSNVLMSDIDVNHWRNLQSLLLESAKGKRRIILIHENGELLKAVHSQRAEIVCQVARVDDPHAVAKQVYHDNEGKADFVLVFERNAVDRYTAQFQDSWNPDEDLDAFEHRQFALLDQYQDGIVTYPRPARETLGLQWRVGASYEAIQAAVNNFVPADSTVVFGVFQGESLWATLVLHFDAGRKASVVTTIDPSQLSATNGDREAIAKEVVTWANRTYGPCSIGLFTDLDSARSFIASQDKPAALRALLSNGKLLVDPLPEELTQSFAAA
jgi:hypothetical protein